MKQYSLVVVVVFDVVVSLLIKQDKYLDVFAYDSPNAPRAV